MLSAGYTNWPAANSYVTRAFQNDGALGFTPLPDLLPNLADAALAWADFDRDGDLDLCAAGTTNVQVSGYLTSVFSNDGAGQFSPVAGGLPAVTKALLLAGDFDNDGWPDLLLNGTTKVGTRQTNVSKIFRNAGNGTFTEYAVLAACNAPKGCLTDLDSDGRLDVVLTGNMPLNDFTRTSKMYLNKGGGQFVDIGPAQLDNLSNPDGVAAGDLAREGRPWLILAARV